MSLFQKAFFLLVFCCLGGIAHAQAAAPSAPATPATAPTVAAPSAKAVALANQLMDMTNMRQIMDEKIQRMVPMIMKPMTSMMMLTKASNQAQKLQEIEALYRQYLAAMEPDMIKITTNAYATNFTESELQDIINFHSTPTGKKVDAMLPKILVGSEQQAMELVQTKLNDGGFKNQIAAIMAKP